MFLKLAFWALVALDTAGLILWCVLGLAAAGSAKTSPLEVVVRLLILPSLPVLVSIFLFTRSQSAAVRGLAFVLVAAPLALLLGTQVYSKAQLARNTNAQGELTFFPAGTTRDLVEALRRNDAATVAALAPRVNLNARGLQDLTPLLLALRQLRETPDQSAALKTLIQAGADPNLGTQYEQPLEMALQLVQKTGPEPVLLLLKAGADPNRTNSTGTPLYFGAAGNGMPPEILDALIAHGAKLDLHGPQGERLLFHAADARNWRIVLRLLEQGVNGRQARNRNGLTFQAMLDDQARWAGADPGFNDVRSFLKQP